MKKIIFLSAILALGIVGLVGCDGNASNNTVTNANTNYSLNRNAANNMATNVNANSNTAVLVNNNALNTNVNGTAEGGSSGFMKEAAQGGIAEVELGKLAASKAQNAGVKAFGQRMVTDHTKANNDLKTVAAKKNVTLPSEVNAEQKEEMDKLSKLSGADFDREYVRTMVEDHEKDVAEFQKQADSSTDADVKAFAARTLPTLKSHLDMIKNIQSKMK